MNTAAEVEPRREPWRYVVRAGVTLAVVVGVVLWLLTSWFLWAFRCDENCGVGDYERWQWTGQLVLAVAGATLAVIAMALGFRPHSRAYRATLMASACCALGWVGVVFLSGL